MNRNIGRLALKLGKVAVITLYGAGILLVIVTAFRGEHYYTTWNDENNSFTYGSSLHYFVAALAAYTCFIIADYHRRNGTGMVRHPWLWLAVSAGFTFAAFDEMLSFHERLGSALDKSSWYHHLYFTYSDDVFVMGYGIIALLFTVVFVRELWPVRQAVRYYTAGVFLLLFAGAIDYLPYNLATDLLPGGVEELAELFAGTSFAAAFVIWGLDRSRLALEEWLSSRMFREPVSSSEPLMTE